MGVGRVSDLEHHSSDPSSTGIFNTYANSANNGNVFVLPQGNRGALATAQLSYLCNQSSSDKGMLGQYTASFFEDNNALATLPLGNRSSNGKAGIFILPHNFRLSEESSMAVVIAGVFLAGSLGGAI